MSKLHVISRGRKKRGTETAQVVIKTGTTSITRHLQKIGGVWADKYGAKYELPS